MQELTLAELEALDPALDLFGSPCRVPAELLAEGLHPPLPVCGRYLVWGFSLLTAARAAGRTALACRLLGERRPEEMLTLALLLEARPGSFRWSEKLAMLAFARSRGFRLGALAKWIEGRPDPRLEERLGEFSALPPALAAAVEAGSLDLQTAARLRGLPEEVFPLAAAPLTFSERKDFLGLLLDLRQSMGPAQTVAAAREALAAGRPVERLRELVSPALAALRRDWAALHESVLGGSGVTLQPPDFFEGDLFEVRFAFRSRQGLARRLAALSRLEARFDELGTFLR